jgi:hypothetical protein
MRGDLVHWPALGPHLLQVRQDVVARLGVDHRPDVHGQPVRVAHAQFGHRTQQHLQHPVGGVFLHAQHAQRGAALAGAVEGEFQHVGHRCSASAEESTIIAFWPPVPPPAAPDCRAR